MEGKGSEVLQKGMVLITKDLIENSQNKAKNDLYELVDVALKNSSTEIYLLNDDDLIQKVQETPVLGWQGEILRHPKLQSIALAALFSGSINKNHTEMLIFYHTAVSFYSAKKVGILNIANKLPNNSTVLEQYISRQMGYALEYHRHHNHPVEISEIEKKLLSLTIAVNTLFVLMSLTHFIHVTPCFGKLKLSQRKYLMS